MEDSGSTGNMLSTGGVWGTGSTPVPGGIRNSVLTGESGRFSRGAGKTRKVPRDTGNARDTEHNGETGKVPSNVRNTVDTGHAGNTNIPRETSGTGDAIDTGDVVEFQTTAVPRPPIPHHRPCRSPNTAPQFQPSSYQATVEENQPAGTPVTQVTAQDPDEGEAGRLHYSMAALFDSRSDDLFTVDPVTGAISTAAPLDRESKSTHVFRVTAVDHGTPRRSAMATLTVTVSDTNDHDPAFEQPEYRESVRENMEVGYEVLTVRATDGDAGPNANVLYRLLNAGDASEVFEIDSRSGVIRTRGPVDREVVDAFELLVEATDQGQDPGPRSATATVRIAVEDDNDNAPQFSERRYVAQVPEDVVPNVAILQVVATDRDKGSNALVHYSIVSGNTRGHFYIDAQTGTLDVVTPLDFEVTKEFTLRIRAQDGGRPPLSNISGLVTIQVLDVNDNAPIFVSTPFQATVLENVPVGYSVIHVQAIDADSGDNSRLVYTLLETGTSFPFTINNSTGWIVVASELDREVVDFYSFEAEAQDHGTPPMASTASVSVTILDVNDNSPEFTQREYGARLNEDAAVGTSVLTVSAVDRDAYSVITYQISSGNTRNRFSITSQSGGGLISLALPLDYKLERQYLLTIAASDGTRQDTAQVVVNVTDANTHRPVFQSSHYTININEDRPVGTTVVVISATDEDTGENARITYLMEDSIPQFSIAADTGAVTTQMELDYEDQVSYTLAITARDNGIPQKSDTTYLEILVSDVNDNAPQFLRHSYQGSIYEDVPTFTSVLQVSATDRDSGLNGRVFYTFQGGDDGDGDFIIESTSGIVRTLRRLDRENVPLYSLQAFAVDKGVPARRTPVEIQVTVLDVNDNPPVFEQDEFDIFVEENSPIGLVVARITATDPDEGTNAQIMYQIVEGNIPEVFQLDIFSGELTALADLDYETKAEYVMVVQATSAPLVSRATIHVRLRDTNDNSPQLKNFEILFNNYITNRSGSFPGGVIGRIPAYDPDVSDHLTYAFEQGNELNLVLLDPHSGDLRLSPALDNNRPLEAVMRVSVSDGVYSATAQCTLRVTVITDEMLSNSITLRLADMSQERFLSPLLSRFLEGVATVLATPRHRVPLCPLTGCPPKKTLCDTNTCHNGGTCVHEWGGFSCRCPLGFGGKTCQEEMVGPQRFVGSSRVAWNGLALPLSLPWPVRIMFRTRHPRGVLLRAGAGGRLTLILQLSEGQVEAGAWQGGARLATLRLPQTKVNDGAWHHVELELRGGPGHSPSATLLLLTLDYGRHQAVGDVPGELQGLRLRTLSLGGLLGDSGTVEEGFQGCLQGLRVGDPVVTADALSLAQAVQVNVEGGCALPDPCDSGPCPPHSYCSDDWDSFSCRCHPGYFGDSCVSACALDPCEPPGTCTRHPGTAPGYACHCPSGTFGALCQHREAQPCPRGWWGHPTCGPCSCDVTHGFDPDCNKTTGECHCKDNHYRPPGGDTCHPCECYPTGSLSRRCDASTGQCPCKAGVIGRHCDRCDNPFAEVTASGCEVNYDSCPRAIEASIWWPRTRFGLPAAAPCPKGSVGTALRHCDEHKGWLPPNLFNCSALAFAALRPWAEQLVGNESRWDAGQSRRMALALREATREARGYFGSDVHLAYRLAGALLRHESRQRGFRLAATQDVHFTENLLRVGSALLDMGNKRHWELIQQTEGGTAQLLQHFEEYARALARNMPQTYLSPFTIVTPNIVVSVVRLDKSSFAGARLPRYEALRGEKLPDLETTVILPDNIFQPPEDRRPSAGHGQAPQGTGGQEEEEEDEAGEEEKVEEEEAGMPLVTRHKRHPSLGEGQAIVSVIIYRTLAGLLPQHFDADKRSLRVPKRPIINTPVVSISVHTGGTDGVGGMGTPRVLAKPITLQFRLLETQERSKPICVFWNHSLWAGSVGGWSARGCEVAFRNQSHVSCQCHHLTSFAVLMDISHRENGEVLPLAALTYGSLGVGLAGLALVVVALGTLRRLRSNRHSIRRHGTAALFLAQLVFLIGINQADVPLACTVVAILLQFLYLSAVGWALLEALHLYRRRSEPRHVDRGPMRFYHVLGWGLPAFITGLAVGLDPEGYGNPDFCWLALHDSLVWSLVGPCAAALAVGIFFLVLAARATCATPQGFQKKGSASGVRTAAVLLAMPTLAWLLALLSVNSDTLLCHYLFAASNCLQGPLIFLSCVVLSKEVRRSLRLSCARCHHPPLATKATLTPAYGRDSTYVAGRLYPPQGGGSSGSLHSTARSGKSHHSYIPFVRREDSGLAGSPGPVPLPEPGGLFLDTQDQPEEHDTESDSDLSLDDPSGSYGSTHSSDSEDEAPRGWDPLPGAHPGPPGPGDPLVSPGCPYWPGEFVTTASESEGPGGSEGLRVQPAGGQGHPWGDPPRPNGEALPRDHLLLPLPQPHKGILKRKCLPPISERGSAQRPGPPPPPPACTAASSGSDVGPPPVPRPRQSLQEQLSGLTPIAMSIRTGTADEDSSGSESDETSI
ncbi:cadherin EGF LAG seven-pass G-type receptor 2-like [Geothlypis trichas]